MNQNYPLLAKVSSASVKKFRSGYKSPPEHLGFTESSWRCSAATFKPFNYLLLTLLLLLTAWDGYSQVGSYGFAYSAGAYTPISGGTVLGSTTIDEQVFNNSTTGGSAPVTSTGFPIGFNFTYNGVSYDKFAVATNGYIVLGTGSFAIANTTTSAISTSTTTGFANVISGFNQDLQGQTGSVLSYLTEGSAPNRTLVVQWSGFKRFSGTSPMNYNFQIRLNETTNTISFVYGTMTTTSSYSAQVGLRGATGSAYVNRTSTTSWASTNPGSSNSSTISLSSTVFPASGTTFTWSPPAPCDGTPVAGTASTPASICSGTAPGSISVTGSTTGVSGLTYQWEESDDDGATDAWANAVGGSGATTTIYSPPILSASRYYRLKVTCTASSLWSTTAAVVAAVVPCDYNVTRTTGITYSSIASTGTGLTGFSSVDDGASSLTNIGFSFFYKGTNYTQFSATTNGIVTLGTTNTAYINSFSSNTNVIAPFWDDLYVTGSVSSSQVGTYIKYKLDGTAPNRVLTVEWIGMEQFNYPGPNLNFQAKLYETSNKIEFVYGSMEPFNGTTSTSTSTSINKWSYSVGLSGPSGTGTYRTLALLGENTSAFGSTDTTTLAVAPDCNVKYEFTQAGAYTGPSTFSYAAPVNDNVAGAITLPVNEAPCTNLCGTYYTTGSATASPQASTCAAAPDDDVWFKFTAPASGQVTISVKGATGFDAVVSLTDETSADIAGFGCIDATTGATSNTNLGQTETLNPTGLTPDAVYYIRVSHKGTGFGSRSGFSVCVNNSVIPPPSNDNPCGAAELTLTTACTPFSDTSAVNSKTSVLSATNTSSNGVAAPACSGAAASVNDVWFKFTASSTSHVLTVTPVAGFDVAAQLYTSAGSCAGNDLALTPVSCHNAASTGGVEQIALTTVANTEYYVRVYRHPAGFTGAPVNNSQFSICVFSPVPACTTNTTPANAATGTSLTPTLTWASAQYATSYDVYLGTQSGPTTLLGNATTTSYTLTAGQALPGLTQHYWYVVPKNTNGAATCGAANQSSFTTQTACRVATGLTVGNLNAAALTVDLSWTAPTAGPAPAGYEYALTTSTTAPVSGTLTTEATVTGQSIVAGTAYYLHVRTSCGNGDFSAWARSSVFRYIAGDTCGTAIDLATLTSPHAGTTANAANNYDAACDEDSSISSPDLFYYIDVMPYYTLTIGQSSNSYDSVIYAGYGSTCPGTTSIACFDEPDTQSTTWMNTTGATQRVYWVQDGYEGGSGAFNLTWSLAPPPDCLPASALAVAINNTSVTASWTASESAPEGGYQYEIRTSGAAGSGSTGLFNSGTVTGTQTSAIPGFTIGSTYTLYLRSVCATSNSPWASKTFMVPVPNDTCETAASIACGQTVAGTTVNATNENMAVCGISNVTTQSTAGVWYKFTGNGNDVTLSTCFEDSGDTRLAVYTGACGTMTCVTGNDDNSACDENDVSSEVLFSTVNGTEYYVLVYNWSTSSEFQISMSCVVPCTPATANDECATAAAVTVGMPLASSNSCATPTTGVAYPSCGSSFGTYYDAWYSFNSGTNTSLEVALNNAPASTGFIVYSGACGSLTPVASSCVLNGAATNVTLTASTNYYIRVYTVGSLNRGSYEVSVKVPCIRPTAVTASAVAINTATIGWTAPSGGAPSGGYEYEVRTSGAAGSGATGLVSSNTTSSISVNLTNLAADMAHSVYVRSVCGAGDYSPWTSVVAFTTLPSCPKPTAVNATNVSVNTATIGWTAPASAPASGYIWEVRSSGAAGSGSNGLFATSSATGTSVNLTALSPLTTYSVYVRSNCGNDNIGSWTTAVTFKTKIANDLCSGAIAVTCGSTVSGTTIDSTNENMAVCGISNVVTQNTPGVWYKYVSNGTDVTFSTCSSTNTTDSRIAVFTGSCNTLTCIGGNDDNSSCTGGTLTSEVAISNTTPGTTYYILVYGFSSTGFAFDFTTSCAPACSPAATNNESIYAQNVQVGSVTATHNTCASASLGVATPTCGPSTFATYYDSWYKFNSGANTSLTVSAATTSPVVVGLAVYSGTYNSLTQVTGACTNTGSALTVTGLTPHTVYYIRAYSTATAARGNFNLSITVPCNMPTGVTATASATTASILWTAATPAPQNGYEYEVRTSGTAGSGAAGLTASGNAATVNTTIAGLTANTAYSIYVRSVCDTGTYSAWTTAVNVFTGYCAPMPTSAAGNGIINVSFDAVNNTTEGETGNYGDYSAMSGTGLRGQAVTVNVTHATAQFTKIWVDWNNDMDFTDSGEAVYTSSSAGTSAAATFTVPASAPLGNHRIRVAGGAASSITPCFAGATASFEDYTLVVTSMGTAHLLPAFCNATITSFREGIFSNTVHNATAYRFRVVSQLGTQVIETPTPWFRLNMLTNYAYGVTYLVDVSVQIAGEWSDYGTACKIFTQSAVPTTSLMNCNAVIDNFDTAIYANLVQAATTYRFKVVSSSATYIVDRPNAYFKLNMLPVYAYGTTYTVSVDVLSGGVWSGYGSSCNISSANKLPSTQLRAADCGITVNSMAQGIYANIVPGAQTYNFIVTSSAGTNTISTPNPYFKLNMVPGYDYNEQYTVTVTVSAPGVITSDAGVSCTVSSPATMPLTSLRSVDCGATIANRDVAVYCNLVPGAQVYRFRIVAASGTYIINRANSAYFKFSMLPQGAVASGETVAVTVMTISPNGSQSAYGSSCSVTLSSLSGRPGANTETKVSVKGYPNPFTETFTLDLTSESEEMVDIVVYDMTGKLVETMKVESAQLPALKLGGNLAAGVYNLIVTQGGTVKTMRVVKNVN